MLCTADAQHLVIRNSLALHYVFPISGGEHPPNITVLEKGSCHASVDKCDASALVSHLKMRTNIFVASVNFAPPPPKGPGSLTWGRFAPHKCLFVHASTP